MDISQNTYSYDDLLESTKNYFNNEDISATTWISKYSLNKDNIYYELNPENMHWRLSDEISRIDNKYPNAKDSAFYFNLFDRFKYIIPQGSPMFGIGNDLQTISISNCFVIGNDEDSYGSILKIDEEQVHLMKRRAGVGHDLSHIRPKHSPVNNSAKTSTGVVPFMERYSNSTREVGQDGRRGALMLSILVSHPDVGDFIDAKMESGKVTGANVSVKMLDEFMFIVKRTNQEDVDLYKTLRDKLDITDSEQTKLDELENKICYDLVFKYNDGTELRNKIIARDIWSKIIHNAWNSAEPGVMFWDKMLSESIGNCYKEYGFGDVSTNPCVTGDTLVAVADGRNSVPIRELAEIGEDVPVYSVDPITGKVDIKMGRNPRLTVNDRQILKITLDDGSSIKTTTNHKFLLYDGTKIEAKDLKCGDSLMRFTKRSERISKNNTNPYYRINTNTKDSTIDKLFEHKLIAKYNNPELWSEKYNANKVNGWVNGGLVVHHKDYNGLNNSPDNLEIMTFREHAKYHADNDTQGEKNGKYSGFTNEDIKEYALDLTSTLRRRFSYKEWSTFAKSKGIPQSLSKWRVDTLGYDLNDLSVWAANKLGFGEYNDVDPRVVKTLHKGMDLNLDVFIDTGKVYINKKCENCNSEFHTTYDAKESTFCSRKCSTLNSWSKPDNSNLNGLRRQASDTKIKHKDLQIKIYSDLKFELDRTPLKVEWEERCKTNNIPFRFGPNSPFKTYKELKYKSIDYNHKVKSVEIYGYEDVYNITVDDNHTLAFITDIKENSIGHNNMIGVFTAQCGEIVLPPYDSCRLTALNLYSYVKNPFTKHAEFDWELFDEHSKYIMRIMDNIVDLELEKIDSILEKINLDPEDINTKQTEIDLWTKIKYKCEMGRRTGIGVTGEGDMLAAMGLIYGTPPATEFSVEVHKRYAINVFRESVQLAKDRGNFPIWDWDIEKDNPFINRILESDPSIKDDLLKYGRRNIGLLTIAPTGTVSMMTQTSSGVEPVFLVSYRRRRKINPTDRNTRVDFVDELGDKWMEFNVFHHKFIDWFFYNQNDIRSNITNDVISESWDYNQCKEYLVGLDENTINIIISMSPYYKATSNDVNWVEKVKMQGEIQKWVDHSISVTVNLPNDIDEDTVDKIYLTAWESGCKGCTIYRDGSRSGVLISNNDTKIDLFEDTKAPKRPKTINCDVIHFTSNGTKWFGFVGLYNDKPYELFTIPVDNIDFNLNNVTNGWIERTKINGKSEYIFIYMKGDDRITTIDLKMYGIKEFDDVSRIVSAILRHGMPIKYVVDLLDGLNLDGDIITSWKSGVKRILKRYINDLEVVTGHECSECKSTNLAYQDGCLTCLDCGSSKCG